MKRASRFIVALWHETLKRVPYILLILLIFILVQGYYTNQATTQAIMIARQNSETNKVLLERIAEVSEDNKSLSEDNKRLSEQGNRLAEQSNHYLDCIAKVFAKYTRDYIPILSVDLNTCSAQNIYTQQIEPIAPLTPSPTPEPAPQDKKDDKSRKPVSIITLALFLISKTMII